MKRNAIVIVLVVIFACTMLSMQFFDNSKTYAEETSNNTFDGVEFRKYVEGFRSAKKIESRSTSGDENRKLEQGEYFQNNCEFNSGYSKDYEVSIFGDDNIVKFVPKEYFVNTGSKFYMDENYGYYIETKTENENNYSSVILMSISRETSIEHDYIFSIKVTNLMQMDYCYVVNPNKKIITPGFSLITEKTTGTAIFKNGISEGVIPLPNNFVVLLPEKAPQYVFTYEESNRISMRDISFGATIYNENSLNSFDDGYNAANDYGYFFTGNSYKFYASKYSNLFLKKVTHLTGSTIVNTAVGFIPVVGPALSILGTSIVYGIDLAKLVDGIRYNETNEEYVYPSTNMYSTRQTQVENYGNLVRASAIAINTDGDDKLYFFSEDYAVGKYEISHADRPGGGREYGRIDINVGIKIVNTEGQEVPYVSENISYDINHREDHYVEEIGVFDYYMLPYGQMNFVVEPEFINSDFSIGVGNDDVDIYVNGELQAKSDGIVLFNGVVGNKYNIVLKNTTKRCIYGKMRLDCDDVHGRHTLESGKEYVYKLPGSKSYSTFSTQNDSVKVIKLYDSNFTVLDSAIGTKDYVTKMQGECMYVVLKNESSATQTIDVVDLGETVMSGSGAIDIANGHTYGMYVFTATGAGDYVFTFKFSKNEESFGVKFYDKGFNSKVSSKVYSQKMTKYRVTLKANEFVYVVVERSPMVYGNIQASYTTQLRGQKYWVINNVKTANSYVSLKRGSVTPIYVETEDGLSLPLTRIETADMYYLSLLNSIVSIKPECRLGTTKAYADVVWVSNDESKTPNTETYIIEITIETDSNLNNAISVFNDDSGFGLKINNSYISRVTVELTNNGSKSIFTSAENNSKCDIAGQASFSKSVPMVTVRIISVRYTYKRPKKVNGVENIVSETESCAVGEYGLSFPSYTLNHLYGQSGTSTYFNLDCMRHFKNFVANASTYGSNTTFKLNANISLSGKWSPIEKFNATLDGGNKTISNLRIDIAQSDSVAEYHGFIARNYGTIKNLKFTGINIIANTHHTDKAINVGGVVGYNYGTVREVIAQGSLNCNRYMSSMGGIIGTNAGTVYRCTAQDYYIYGNGDMGGIAGRMTSGSVKYCQTKKLNMNVYTVNGNRSAGGIVGYMPGGLVEYCCNRDNGVIFFDDFYNVGALSPKMGLIVGHAGSSATVRNVSVQGAKLSYDNLPEKRLFTNCRQHVGAYGNGAVGFCEGATIGSTSWTPTGLYD